MPRHIAPRNDDSRTDKFKKGDVSSESIEAALGGEEYKAYKNVLRGYTVLQKELSEIESIDKNVKTKEQTTRQIQLRKELSELKNKAVEIKQDLQNKVLEKIDVDNIRLKNRESYLGSGYKKEFQDVANENLFKVKQSQKIDEKAFVDGLWGRDEKPTHNDSAENVESSQLESVENFDESGIINYSQKQQEFFDINLLPEQMHHFATNKNKKYTPKFNDIVSKYGLNLDDPWNKEMMKHRGKHPYTYHDYILYKMRKCDITAEGDVEIFKKEFEIVKKKIIDNPYMLRKAFWKGKDNEILFDDV